MAALLGAELIAWSDWWQRRLLRFAAAAMPCAFRERYFEEWLGELAQIPNGPVTRSIWVLSIVMRRRSIARSVGSAERSIAWILKRALDALLSAAAIVALGPLLIVVALAIRIESPGPVFFRKLRVGEGGKSFRMWHFRTMAMATDMRQSDVYGSNEHHELTFSHNSDPRVTRVGRLLRRYSLDSLPELLNVAVGQMSLVGPRPLAPDAVTEEAPVTRSRQQVLPGITGLWQVAGRRDLTWEDALRDDQRYVENWSFVLDLVILWKTVLSSLRRDSR